MISTRIRIICCGVAMFVMAPAAGAQESPPLRVENGRVTASVRNVSARAFLGELGLRSKVAIFTAEEIGDDTISVEWSDVPVEDAVPKAVVAYDAFLYYEAGEGGTRALRSVWVYPRGAAKMLRPIAAQFWAGTRELEAALADPDAQVRAQAYEALIQRPNGRSRELLLAALRGRETDEGLRQRILSTAGGTGVIPPGILAEVARTDSSEEVRWMALDALSHHESAKEIAEALKTDPSEAVRQKAAEVLLEVSAAAHRQEAGARAPEAPQP